MWAQNELPLEGLLRSSLQQLQVKQKIGYKYRKGVWEDVLFLTIDAHYLAV